MIDKLKKYEKDGLLFSQTHPTLPLIIWNYSDKVQYEVLWDEVTLICRGLVTDLEGNIVARPFRKFFNIGEEMHTPSESFSVFEKMDGSLGILFQYDNQWVFASRGSFNSEQAVKGKEILSRHDLSQLNGNCTYLFEIIYPGNRIVVDYSDKESLVLLGIIDTKTGDEFSPESAGSVFEVVKRYDGIKDYQTLKETISDDREGYVVKFSNGDRVKIKGDEYLRLHRIMTSVSTASIWECLKNGEDLLVLLKDVPDEFYDKVHEWVRELNARFDNKFAEINAEFYEVINRKEFAETVKDSSNKHFLFTRLNTFSDNLNKMIWDSIKPEYKRI